jgi:hypothetical protein
MRTEFPRAGKAKAPRPSDTPIDRYDSLLSVLGTALEALEQAFDGMAQVVGHDGRPLVDARGVDYHLVKSWRDLLSRIDEEMLVWGRTFRKVYGTDGGPANHRYDGEVDDSDPYAENGDEAKDGWDQVEITTEREVTA